MLVKTPKRIAEIMVGITKFFFVIINKAMQVLKTILLISIILSSSNVQAQTNTGDTAWILTSSSLVCNEPSG